MDRFKKAYIKTKEIWSEFPSAGALLVFFTVFSSYAAIYFWTPGVRFIDDHFFHFKFAYLIRTQGWDAVKNFDWIYLTRTVKDHTPYPVSLFQLSLIPFTYVKDMILGLKISDAFWGSMSIAVIYFVFRKAKIKYPEIFLLILVSASFFATRMVAGRAFVFSSALSLVLLYLASEKKHSKLFFFSVLYVLWHQSTFFIPLLIACMVESARALAQQKMHLKNIAAAALGSLISLLVIPGSIINGVRNIFATQLSVTVAGLKGEGNELYKADIFQVFGRSEIFLLLLVVSYLVVIYLYVRSKKNGIEAEEGNSRMIYIYSAFLLSLMSLAGSILASGRFFDFYFPSVIFLFGAVTTKLLEDNSVSVAKGIGRSILAGIAIFFAFSALNTFLNLKKSISDNDYTPVARAAEWIKGKSTYRELVYVYNWGDFPVSFFFNDKNVYSMGIEPRALFGYDESLYWKWYNISSYGIYCSEPRDCEDVKEKYVTDFENADKDTKDRINKENARRIIESIRNDFGARFVIVNGKTSEIFKTNEDMVEDSFEAKSETGSGAAYAFELK